MILDAGLISDREMVSAARAVIRGGADSVQLRCKARDTVSMIGTASAVAKVCRRRGVPLVINDRIEVALAAGSSGVHLGQGDIDITLARRLLGPRALIGVSASGTSAAVKAMGSGASYIGAGPAFRTPIKPSSPAISHGSLAAMARRGVPVMAIGGVDSGNVCELTGIGVRSVAVIRAVCAANDRAAAVRKLKRAMAKTR